MYKHHNAPPVGLTATVAFFGSASLALIIITKLLIPFLVRITGQEAILFWFLTAGLGVFFPLILVATFLLHQEGNLFREEVWSQRLRFKKLTRTDWLWVVGGLTTIVLATTIILWLLQTTLGEISMHPPFMEFEPLTPERYWLLAIWLPFWGLNIMGEEILWRGVILPRQEAKFG